MKILLISGHGAGDSGAVGNGYKEADLTREVVNMLSNKLINNMEVTIYNQERNAYEDVNNGKLQVIFSDYDYVFEVHFNAYNGTAKGTEIFVTREEPATEVEEKIMQQLSKYFVVRGVKRKNFDVIAKARRSGVSSALIEVCFIDNAEDMQIYQSNKDGIAIAIVNGIVEGFSVSKENKENTQTTQTTKSIVDLANEVIAGKYGTGEARKQALGSLYNEVQAKVNEILTGKKQEVKPTKSVNEIVDEVIAGKWGIGEDRKTRLKNAGYNYETIQSAVNNKLKGNTSNKKSNEVIANEVMQGLWGNGKDRKTKLTNAGYDYNAIQKIVNSKVK